MESRFIATALTGMAMDWNTTTRSRNASRTTIPITHGSRADR